jgi:hypothetical protein
MRRRSQHQRQRLVIAFAVTVPVSSALCGLACSTPSSQPQGPVDGSTTGEPTAVPTADIAVAAESSAPTAVGRTGEITNSPPDGGVVMDNATPPGDGGPSTRLQPIIDVMVANSEKFRACFDVWGQTNPGHELKVMLTIKLEPNGKLATADFKPDETQVVDKPMESCMAEVAKSLKFPASPNEQPTRYNHRFVFKAKKS